jgi:phosphoglycerol transferase MdoB-like AlkP superfamily enzyme
LWKKINRAAIVTLDIYKQEITMFEHPVFLPSSAPISLSEILVVLVIASIAYFLVFNNFERHLPAKRRVIKLFVVIGVLASIGILFGRYAFWGAITLMTIGQVLLHAWYFPKQGINGLTAEPYERYLTTIQKMKGQK